MKIIAIFTLLMVAAMSIDCLTIVSFAATQKENSVCLEKNKECDLLNRLYSSGRGAGNTGDWYDNRDGGHSMLQVKNYTQLSLVTYTDDEKEKKLHWSGQKRILRKITIGNSSTSSSVKTVGSNARSHYYTWPKGLKFLYGQCRNSNLYVYPEHRDYDAGHNGRPKGYGDLYPTNTPYLVISQGSSGSDQKFVLAFFKTLAAFRPDVKEELYKTGLLMPTLQMIFRSSNKNIRTKQEYLTDKAHPTVFQGYNVNTMRMIERANRIRMDNIPPLVGLKVIEEDISVNGMDYFESEGSEKLADTPSVIARIFRSTAYEKRMVVSAEGSFDINKRPLSYHWVVLRGDPDRIIINTRNGGSVSELIIPYHTRQPISKRSKIDSNRVDIGVFVNNGVWHSAPGFVTVFFLDNEVRTYHSDGRILDIYYDAAKTDIGYPTSDSRVFISKNYDIFNWYNFLDTILSKDYGFATVLLRKQFHDLEMKAILEIFATFKPIYQKKMKLDEELKGFFLQNNKLKRHILDCKKKLVDVEAAYRSFPNPETEKVVSEAKSAYDDAEMENAENQKRYHQIRDDQNDVHNRLKKVFLSKNKGIKQNIKNLLEGALNRIKNDLHLYINNKEAIHAMVYTAEKDKAKRYEEVMKRFQGYGLQLFQQNNASKSSDTNTVEKNLIQQFNLFLMNEVLFPHFLKRDNIKNFVDYRLTIPKAWRDVYHYNKDDHLTGWTRYDGNSATEYTPAGNLVIDKDVNGRVSKVQPVKYEIDGKSRKLRVVSTK